VFVYVCYGVEDMRERSERKQRYEQAERATYVLNIPLPPRRNDIGKYEKRNGTLLLVRSGGCQLGFGRLRRKENRKLLVLK